MTLVLTAACPYYVVQVADRLVSMRDHKGVRPGDPQANKTIVYQASDAIVVIGYAGLAYIGEVPSDEWMVEILWGTSLGEERAGRSFAVRMGRGANHWNIGFAIQRLSQAIADKIPLKERFEVSIAGWQTKDRRFFPILIDLHKLENGAVHVERAPRHWVPGSDFRIHSIGARVDRSDLGSRLERYRSGKGVRINAPQVETLLVEAIRHAAAREATVGSDLLSVYLPIPGTDIPRSRFLPLHQHSGVITGTNNRVAVDQTPWIIGRNGMMAPCFQVGDTETAVLGSRFIVGGAPPGNEGVVAAISSVRRPSLSQLRNRTRRQS
jgi:hypothetical protein